jgi:hypothetical protein
MRQARIHWSVEAKDLGLLPARYSRSASHVVATRIVVIGPSQIRTCSHSIICVSESRVPGGSYLETVEIPSVL